MRKVYITLVLILFVSVFVHAQTEILPCPTLTLTSPTSITMPGETMAFSLKAEGRVEESKLRHKWTVSEGYIIEGQNTSMIKVATTPDLGGSVITAKVTIEGLPKNCANEASETSSIGVIPGCGFGVDDYRKIPLQEEYGRLDNLFSRLLYDLEYKGFILISIDEIETVDQAKKHIKKLMRHVKFRKFAKERLVFAIEKKSDYHLTRLFAVPQNTEFPECNNCEIIKGEDTN